MSKLRPTVEEVIDRAEREGWTRLALLGLGVRPDLQPQRVRALCERGWADAGIVVLTEPLADIAALVARLAQMRELRELVLEYCHIDDVGARAIAERLTGLTSLDLRGNAVGKAGARAIAERLTGLTSLDLCGNAVGKAGARAIAERLTGLTSLDLRGNAVGEAGASACTTR